LHVLLKFIHIKTDMRIGFNLHMDIFTSCGKLLIVCLVAVVVLPAQCTSSACPLGFDSSGLGCYKLVKSSKQWYSAEVECARHGGNLAVITSDLDQRAVRKYLDQQSNGMRFAVWIGLTDVMGEGNWMWSNGQQLGRYNNWYPGEPNNYHGKQDCVYMAMQYDYQWLDLDCEAYRFSLCEATSY